jgi:hypothetical protein
LCGVAYEKLSFEIIDLIAIHGKPAYVLKMFTLRILILIFVDFGGEDFGIGHYTLQNGSGL